MTLGLGWPVVGALALLGCTTGFLAGLLGIGGGMLMVPFVTLLLSTKGVPQAYVVKMAIATSLATIVFTSIASVRAHHRHGAVRWEIVRLLAPGIVLGALIGAQLAKAMPARALTILFAVFVTFSALQMLIDRKPRAARALPGRPGMFAVGGGIGMLASLVGAGGAFVSVPFLVWCNVRIQQAVATSAALGFPIAFGGAIGYVVGGWAVPGLPAGSLGFVYLPALLVISLASVLTAPLGARTAHRLPTRQLRRAFAVLFMGLAATMIYKAVAP